MKQSRSRGASRWTMDIYDALWEHRDTGLTRDQLLDECARRFNRSGTMEWHRRRLEAQTSNDVGPYSSKSSREPDYRSIVRVKMDLTLQVMRRNKNIRNLGTKGIPVYAVMDPPNHPLLWQPRTYRPGHFRDYDPDAERALNGRHALSMRWPEQARAELSRPRPRSAELIRLVEEALTLLDR